MLKVMHVLRSRQYSGAENVAIMIMNLTKEQIDSTYISPAGPIRDYLADKQYFPLKKLSILEVKRAINEIKPDIIHAHDFTAGVISACAAGSKIPIINHLHSDPPWIKRYGLYSFLYASTYFRYKKILTVSEAIMNEYVFGEFFKKKTEIMRNVVDVDLVRRRAGEIEEDKSSNIKHYDVSFLGRFSPQKNLFLFLEIIAEVKRAKHDVSVIMIGDGELRPEIEKRIKELNLEKNIELVGFQKNPYMYLNQAKTLCMPSSIEAFGLTAVEALALGKPVVCSRVGGLADIVTDNCGKLCKNITEYTQEILQLINDNSYYTEKSQNAVIRSGHFDNLNQYIGKINQIYQEILE